MLNYLLCFAAGFWGGAVLIWLVASLHFRSQTSELIDRHRAMVREMRLELEAAYGQGAAQSGNTKSSSSSSSSSASAA